MRGFFFPGFKLIGKPKSCAQLKMFYVCSNSVEEVVIEYFSRVVKSI